MCPSVTISADAARTISSESKASADGRETGGILLGHDVSGELYVRKAGGPGPAAQRSKRRFLRDLQYARDLADAAYDLDGSVWLGEWHTHPQGPVEPSDIDLTTYAAHLSDTSLRFNRFLACVVLPCPKHRWAHVSLCVWIITGTAAVAADVHIEEGDTDA
jgi:integrative and conjugative element protein (TIGR02256 family)